jgi:hypothetical protein
MLRRWMAFARLRVPKIKMVAVLTGFAEALRVRGREWLPRERAERRTRNVLRAAVPARSI